MADLTLEEGNTAEKGTQLIATPYKDDPNRLNDFRGAYILELKPGVTLVKGEHRSWNNQAGGLFSRGIGTGPGVHGVSSTGHGVRGEGGIGVRGSSAKAGSVGVQGMHTGADGFGVRGEASGSGTGVLGQSVTGTGVLGIGAIGVRGSSGEAGSPAVIGTHSGPDGYGVWGDGTEAGAGVFGRNRTGDGVRGEGNIGVVGVSEKERSAGVWGQNFGRVETGFGVVGDGVGNGAGVLGRNVGRTGPGVRGEGDTGVFGVSGKPRYAALAGWHPAGRDGFGVLGSGDTGVLGVSDRSGSNAIAGVHTGDGLGVVGAGQIGVCGISSKPGYAAVAGAHSNEGFGVVGDAAGGTHTAGVLGRHAPPFGAGVRGEGSPGVVGECSAHGAGAGAPSGIDAGVVGKSHSGAGIFGSGRYGGQFRGSSAQLHLVPAETVGYPTDSWHDKGEIHMDAEAVIFVCVADGNPGAWVRVATEPA